MRRPIFGVSVWSALLAFAPRAAIAALAFSPASRRDLNLSTRPSISTSFSWPVKNGCEALEMWIFTSGYSLPSSHLVVSSALIVERVKMRNPLLRSSNTTCLYSFG